MSRRSRTRILGKRSRLEQEARADALTELARELRRRRHTPVSALDEELSASDVLNQDPDGGPGA